MTAPLQSRIIVATQDPFGYYHFTRTLKHYLNQLGDVRHLVPALPQRVGEPPRLIPKPPDNHFQITNDVNSITDAALVIIIGGTMSYWTYAVGKRANEKGVPVLFLEADYPAVRGVSTIIGDIDISKTIVSSVATQLIINSYFGVPEEKSVIVGLPLVDDLPQWEPTDTARRVVISTSVSSEMPDGGRALIEVADCLVQENWDVVVSLHAHEDKTLWSRFPISKESAIHTASRSDVVVTYPSSILVPLHVMRVPTVTMLFDERFMQIVPKSFIALGEPTFDIDDTIKMVEDLSMLAFNDAEPPTQTVSERVARTIHSFMRQTLV